MVYLRNSMFTSIDMLWDRDSTMIHICKIGNVANTFQAESKRSQQSSKDDEMLVWYYNITAMSFTQFFFFKQ